jgi:hypothetical protein
LLADAAAQTEALAVACFEGKADIPNLKYQQVSVLNGYNARGL